MRSAARSSRVGRTSEEEYRTEPYGTPNRDDDEESQLGGSAVEEHHDENASMGIWADEDSGHRDEEGETTRSDVRGTSTTVVFKEEVEEGSEELERRAH